MFFPFRPARRDVVSLCPVVYDVKLGPGIEIPPPVSPGHSNLLGFLQSLQQDNGGDSIPHRTFTHSFHSYFCFLDELTIITAMASKR